MGALCVPSFVHETRPRLFIFALVFSLFIDEEAVWTLQIRNHRAGRREVQVIREGVVGGSVLVLLVGLLIISGGAGF